MSEQRGIWTNEGIRVKDVLNCIICGRVGKERHSSLRDRLFDAPGVWSIRRCGRCGLYWLDPKPLDEDLSKLYKTYWTHEATVKDEPSELVDGEARRFSIGEMRRLVRDGYMARHYGYRRDEVPAWVRSLGALAYLSPSRRVARDRKFFFIPPRPGKRLLEVGFGTGDTLVWLTKLGWLAEGLEVDPIAVEQAANRGLNVRLGRLEDVAYPDAHFDAVVSSHVIEHVADPLKFLQESSRILKPGGVLVAVTPNPASLGHRLFGDAWRGLEPPRHLYLFPIPLLKLLVEQSGFHGTRVDTITGWTAGVLAHSKMIKDGIQMPPHKVAAASAPFWAKAVAVGEEVIIRAGWNVGEETVLVARR
jgi:2-polyprenyl-3-methyl-5-hydroxy-6-metoxy-1,4-benzoquinol methylase